MWSAVSRQFTRQKARREVVRKMIECGIRTGDGKLFVGDVEVDYSALARSSGVDRRVVRQTVDQIAKDAVLDPIFSKIAPSGASLVNVASRLGYSTIVVEANPRAAGVISAVTRVLADNDIVVRQALADDPDMVAEARLTLIVQGNLSGRVMKELESLSMVESITVRK